MISYSEVKCTPLSPPKNIGGGGGGVVVKLTVKYAFFSLTPSLNPTRLAQFSWEHFSNLVDLALSVQYPCTPCGHSGEQKWGLSTKLCISIV